MIPNCPKCGLSPEMHTESHSCSMIFTRDTRDMEEWVYRKKRDFRTNIVLWKGVSFFFIDYCLFSFDETNPSPTRFLGSKVKEDPFRDHGRIEKLEPLGESLLVWFEDGSIFQIQVNQNQWLRRIYSKEVHI
jgi:hypothetical protein